MSTERVHRYALSLKGVKDCDIDSSLRLIEFFGVSPFPIDTYMDRLDSVVEWASWTPEDVF